MNSAVYVTQMASTANMATGHLPTPSGEGNPFPLLFSIVIGAILGVVIYKILG